MTPQALIELIREIERFEQHRRELAGTISAAYDESSPDDSDSLLLDDAERTISGLAGTVDHARQRVLTYLGVRTLAEKAEVEAS